MRISVKQVLSESISFYRKNFNHLVGISFVVFLFLVLTQASGYIPVIIEPHPIWIILASLFGILLMIAEIIILPKLYLAMLILIDALSSGKQLTVGRAYRQTTGKYWLMVGYFLLVALFWSIPQGVISALKLPFDSVISAICMAFVTSLFYTLMPMIALEPRTNRYLRRSVQMIKGNYLTALILTFITTTLLSVINGTLVYLFRGKSLELSFIALGYALVYFFIYPFIHIVSVTVYRKLAARTVQVSESASQA